MNADGNIPAKLLAGCEDCFGPLEVDYHYDAIARVLTREIIASRPNPSGDIANCCRWKSDPVIGCRPEQRPGPGRRLGTRARNRQSVSEERQRVLPTLSFKDRVTAIAVNKAIEFKLEAVGCASTGNLANSVAANAAAAGLPSFILIPENLEQSKVTATRYTARDVIAVRGNYDDVNRLCGQIADRHPWGFVNVNLRPYYAEGSKTFGYEIAEQLGWQAPDAIVVPMAGGALISKDPQRP